MKCLFCNKKVLRKKNQKLCSGCANALGKNYLRDIVDISLKRKSIENLKNQGGKK